MTVYLVEIVRTPKSPFPNQISRAFVYRVSTPLESVNPKHWGQYATFDKEVASFHHYTKPRSNPKECMVTAQSKNAKLLDPAVWEKIKAKVDGTAPHWRDRATWFLMELP